MLGSIAAQSRFHDFLRASEFRTTVLAVLVLKCEARVIVICQVANIDQLMILCQSNLSRSHDVLRLFSP